MFTTRLAFFLRGSSGQVLWSASLKMLAKPRCSTRQDDQLSPPEVNTLKLISRNNSGGPLPSVVSRSTMRSEFFNRPIAPSRVRTSLSLKPSVCGVNQLMFMASSLCWMPMMPRCPPKPAPASAANRTSQTTSGRCRERSVSNAQPTSTTTPQ